MKKFDFGSLSARSTLFGFFVGAMFASGAVWASGGISSNSVQGSGPSRPVDQAYELGKAIYAGKATGVQKIKYCLPVDDGYKKLKRSTARSWKKAPVADFAKALVVCENPEQMALTTLEPQQARLVLYYLNKRYNLKLGDS